MFTWTSPAMLVKAEIKFFNLGVLSREIMLKVAQSVIPHMTEYT